MGSKNTIVVGDKVGYSKKFLRSISQYTGPLPFARGTVTEIKDYGGIAIAAIDWDTNEAPEKVNVRNLSKVGSVNF